MKKTIMIITTLLVCCSVSDTFAQERSMRGGSLLGRARRNRVKPEDPMARLRGAGITKPFVPFNELQKIAFSNAVELAKNNNPTGYYWMAYHLKSKDFGVSRDDPNAAWAAMNKAAEMGYPDASYFLAQVFERYILDGTGISDCGWRYKGDRKFNVTNDTDMAYVIMLYSKAAENGLVYATNDIARIKTKIENKRAQLIRDRENSIKKQEERLQFDRNAQEAILLLNEVAKDDSAVVTEAKESGEKTVIKEQQKVEDEQKKLVSKNELDEEREFWKSWPVPNGKSLLRSHSDAMWRDMMPACAKQFNIIWVGGNDRIIDQHSAWTNGCNVGLIIYRGRYSCQQWEKYSANGVLEKIGPMTIFEEYVWMTNTQQKVLFEEQRVLREQREKWAAEHNMSYESATNAYEKYRSKGIESLPAPISMSLRQRRLQRENKFREAQLKIQYDALIQAEADIEKAQRAIDGIEKRVQKKPAQEEDSKAHK